MMQPAEALPEVIESCGRLGPPIAYVIGGFALAVIITFLVRRLVRLLADLFLTPKDDDHDPHH